MKLEIRQCECGRFAIRVCGSSEWCRWLRGGLVEDVKKNHEVVAIHAELCEICQFRALTTVYRTAGATH